MRRLIYVLPFLLLAAALAVSCSTDGILDSDDFDIGDPTDPDFEEAKADIDSAVISAVHGAGMGLLMVEGFDPDTLDPGDFVDPSGSGPDLYPWGGGKLAAAAGDSTYGPIYDSGWWYMYALIDSSGQFLEFFDSLQYLADTTPQMFPNTSSTSMQNKAFVTLVLGGEGLQLSVDLEQEMLFSGLNTDVITVTGSASYAADMAMVFNQQEYTTSVTVDQTINAVTFDVSGGVTEEMYPYSGSMTFSMDRETAQGSESYEVEITFYPDRAHIVANDGSMEYEYDLYWSSV